MKCLECGNDMGDMGEYLKDKDAGSKVARKEIGCPECGTIFMIMKGEDGNVMVSMIEESRPKKSAAEEQVNKEPKTDNRMIVMDPNEERNDPYKNSAKAYVWRPGENK